MPPGPLIRRGIVANAVEPRGFCDSVGLRIREGVNGPGVAHELEIKLAVIQPFQKCIHLVFADEWIDGTVTDQEFGLVPLRRASRSGDEAAMETDDARERRPA